MIQRSRIPGYSTQATALNLEELVASSCKQLFLRTNNFRPARSSKMIMSRCMVAVTYGPGDHYTAFLTRKLPVRLVARSSVSEKILHVSNMTFLAETPSHGRQDAQGSQAIETHA